VTAVLAKLAMTGCRRCAASASAALVIAGLALSACTPLAGREARLATSTHGCMQSVVDEKLPAGLESAQAHCLAAGLIARYCSRGEAWMASIGKELQDTVGSGDADWRDLEAGRRGLRCARDVGTDRALRECCAGTGDARSPTQPETAR
jgi:hypothetical protein